MKKILIVDDEASFLLSVKDGLRVHRSQFEVVTANNGREAVELLREMPVDLLVTDLKLPEMNGFELLAWVSRHRPQLPVIAMSAFGTPDIEARLARMDALQFLEKPLDLQDLESAIFSGLKAGGKSFIRGITLATFLQLMNVEKKNCTLRIASPQGPAFLFIRRGELIDAEFGHLTGLAAALEVVSWNDAEIEMDAVCRRQADVINMPMGHLLIEAYKLKDEAAEQIKSTTLALVPVAEELPEEASSPNASQPVSPAAGETGSQLFKLLGRLPAVQEFVLFDGRGKVTGSNAGSCSIQGVDTVALEQLLAPVAQELQWQNYRSLVMNTAGRHRFLLLCRRGDRLLLKLKTGAQAQPVLAELERFFERQE